MKKYHVRLSIRHTLMIFMFSVVFALCVSVVINNDRMMQKLVSEYMGVWSKQIIDSVSGEMNATFQYVDRIVNSLVNSSAITQYIREDVKKGPRVLSEAEAYREMQFLKKSIWEFYDDRYRIPFIYLRFNEKQYTVGAISGTSLYEGLDEKIEEAVNNEPWESVTVYLKEREVQLISYHVSDLSSGQKLYDLVLALDLAQFSTVLSDGKIGESGRIMVVDSHGESIYPSTVSDENWNEVQEYLHEQKLLQVTRQESVLHRFGRWQVLTARTRFQNWYVVGYMLTDEVISDIFDPFMVWLVPGLALIITGIFIIWFSHKISKPIMKIVSIMKQAENSNFTDGTMATEHSFRETAYISNQFNEMMGHIRRLISEVQKAEEERSAAELASLQAQIRPHFIYNTLENINMALIIRGQRDISGVVRDLGDIMRYNINPQRKEVSLEEDMEQVEKYLHIQQFRFGKKLNYKISLAPSTRHLIIEKLLIQPLVENSVIHGVGSRQQGGTVCIESWREDECLCIRIADDGVGFHPDKAQVAHSVWLFGKGGHIGMNNVQRRIEYRYGKEYGLRFETVEKGTSIVIVLPVTEEENERNVPSDGC